MIEGNQNASAGAPCPLPYIIMKLGIQHIHTPSLPYALSTMPTTLALLQCTKLLRWGHQDLLKHFEMQKSLTNQSGNFVELTSLLVTFPLSICCWLIMQCCGSGSWIRDPVPFWPLDPGSGMCRKSGSGSGSRIRAKQPGSYFWVLRNPFLG